MKNDCVFCAIANKATTAYLVYETAVVVAILDSDPINEGHVLIIPRSHYLDIDEIPESIVSEIFNIASKITKAIKKVYSSDGYCLMQNGGKFNDIGHFHLHVFPRYLNDGFCVGDSVLRSEVSEEIANKIRKAMD